jgi:hypothetical protein
VHLGLVPAQDGFGLGGSPISGHLVMSVSDN